MVELVEMQQVILSLVREKREILRATTGQEPNLVKVSPALRQIVGNQFKSILGMEIETEYNSGVILEVGFKNLLGSNKLELHNLVRRSYFDFINSTGRVPKRVVLGREIFDGLGRPKKLYGMDIQVSDLEGVVICLERHKV